jgi:hypothetical protein
LKVGPLAGAVKGMEAALAALVRLISRRPLTGGFGWHRRAARSQGGNEVKKMGLYGLCASRIAANHQWHPGSARLLRGFVRCSWARFGSGDIRG